MHTTKKVPRAARVQKITMMMGKCYPTFCAKSHSSHLFPLSFFFIHFLQVDNMFFLCFLKFQSFWGSWRYVWLLTFVFFMWLVFPLKTNKNSTKTTSFFAILLLHCVEKQTSPYAVDCCGGTSFLVKKSKFWLTFLLCIFWLDSMQHFLTKTNSFSFAFFTGMLGIM